MQTNSPPRFLRFACATPRSALISAAQRPPKPQGNEISGKVLVVLDHIYTDQYIPAEYLTFVQSNPHEYRTFGSCELFGLPAERYRTPYVKEVEFDMEYPNVVAGEMFGSGGSQEHAPVAIGAAGGCAAVVQRYARIFLRNCSATGELYL